MISKILYSNTITLVRAILALATLLTLLFNDINDLFPSSHMELLKSNSQGIFKINYFLLFDDLLIPYIFSILILIIVISGYFPRYFCIIHSWVTYSIFYSMLIVEGGDQINTILTFLLIFVCILDKRKNGWAVTKTPMSFSESLIHTNAFIVLGIIQFQMAVLYFNAGIAKLYAPEWNNGTAVYYWFNDNMFGANENFHILFRSLFSNIYFVNFINWSVILLEITLFIGIFLKQKFKNLLFISGFILHFLIILIHGLPTFFLSMLAGLILYFWRLDITIKENLINLKITFKNFIFYEKLQRNFRVS